MPDDHGPTYTAVRDQLELGVAVSDPRPLDRAVHGALLAIAQGIDELRESAIIRGELFTRSEPSDTSVAAVVEQPVSTS